MDRTIVIAENYNSLSGVAVSGKKVNGEYARLLIGYEGCLLAPFNTRQLVDDVLGP